MQNSYCYLNGIGTKINKEKGFILYDEVADGYKIVHKTFLKMMKKWYIT